MQQLDDRVLDPNQGLVQNHILVMRTRRQMTAREVAAQLPAVTPPIYSTIENGRVMPTKAGLKAICCALQCAPTDLYPADQLMLADPPTPTPAGTGATLPASKGRGHSGQEEFRAWLRSPERQTLRNVVMALGYRSEAEWLREMRRNTIARARRLGLYP